MSKSTFTSTVEIKVDLPKDTIYDYISNTKNEKIGIMIAYPDETAKKIMLGYSRCHSEDQFNMVIGLQHALNCSKRISESMLYNLDEMKDFSQEWKKFISRVKRYYQQLMFKPWCMPSAVSFNEKTKQIAAMVSDKMSGVLEKLDATCDYRIENNNVICRIRKNRMGGCGVEIQAPGDIKIDCKGKLKTE